MTVLLAKCLSWKCTRQMTASQTEFKNSSPNTFPPYQCPLCQRYSRFGFKEAQVNTWLLSSSDFPSQKWQALCCRCWSHSFKGHLILRRFLWPMTFISSGTCDLAVLECTACCSSGAKLLSMSCVFSKAGTAYLLQCTSGCDQQQWPRNSLYWPPGNRGLEVYLSASSTKLIIVKLPKSSNHCETPCSKLMGGPITVLFPPENGETVELKKNAIIFVQCNIYSWPKNMWLQNWSFVSLFSISFLTVR